MRKIELTAYDLAGRFIGMKEVAGGVSNPAILAMLQLDQKWPDGDDVPWCSAFANYVAWLLRLPRSKGLRARSWLSVGRPVGLDEAQAGFDVAVLRRAQMDAGPEIVQAAGHVGFFGGVEMGRILLLGGNQGDAVTLAHFPAAHVLGVRRLLD